MRLSFQFLAKRYQEISHIARVTTFQLLSNADPERPFLASRTRSSTSMFAIRDTSFASYMVAVLS